MGRVFAVSEDPFAPAAEAGIHRLAIPTPFAVGRVNVYLIDDSPLTLVDAGPNSGTSFDVLERGIATLGHSLEDIELVILTHHHIDHLGLVSLVAERSGAEVAAIDAAVPFVENFSTEAQAEDDFALDIMLRNGIPEDVAAALQAVSRVFRAWGARVDVTRPLRDGDALEFANRTLHVHHRPGHSPSDTVFHDRERRILIAADHLLGHISSNPLITRPRDGSQRSQALVQYLDSLAATREMDVDLVLPGHGDPFTKPPRDNRRTAGPSPPPRRQDLPPARGAAALGLRDRAGAMGQHRRHPSVPHSVRGAGSPGPPRERGAGARDRPGGSDCV